MAASNFVAVETGESYDGILEVDISSSASAGNIAILAISTNFGYLNTATVPAGWEAVSGFPMQSTSRTDSWFGLWWVEVGSGTGTNPGDTVTVTLEQNNGRTFGAVYVLDGGEIVDATGVVFGNDPSTAPYQRPTPALSGLSGDYRLVHFWGICSNDSGNQPSWTAPSGVTERAQGTTVHGAARNASLLVADEVSSEATSPTRTAEASARMHWITAAVAVATAAVRPVADAGTSQTVSAGATGVQLVGSATGGAGGSYTYLWRIVTDTTGGASLSATNVPSPLLDVGPNSGQVVLGLTVTDSASVESIEDTVTIVAVGAENSSIPIGDVTTAGWAKVPSDATNFASVLGDGDDGTYIYYVDPDGTEVVEVSMSTWNLPQSGEQGFLRYRSSIFQATSGTATVYLKQGSSTIIGTYGPDNWTQAETVQEFIHEVTAEQIADITDETALRVRIEGTAA